MDLAHQAIERFSDARWLCFVSMVYEADKVENLNEYG